MRLSGYGFVVGRSEAEGDFKDVRIRTTPEGYNYLELARDPRDTSPRTYVVDRRTTPAGAWSRVLRVESFTPGTDPFLMSETGVEVEYEDFRNAWGITPERTYGLPAGMESPWTEPLEMVGNELLLPDGARWVSGDAPINTFVGRSYSNGRYAVTVEDNGVEVSLVGGRRLAYLRTVVGNAENAMSVEGTAGVVALDGGTLHVEPGKPPMFIGHFALLEQPKFVRPGLYDAGGCYLVSTHPIEGGRGGGAVSVVADPYPERWIPRMMCRAFARLSNPSNVPPLVEDVPERVSVAAVYPETDFPGIPPEVTTPYANKIGVFNSWEVEGGVVRYRPSDRPWDVLLAFNGNLEDLGGHAVEALRGLRPALDRGGLPLAAYPQEGGYVVRGLPEAREGTIFLRWKDSSEFQIMRSHDIDAYYKRGYVYLTSQSSPEATGIAKISVGPDWQATKIDWDTQRLWVNDEPALQDKRTWGENMFKEDGTPRTWGEASNNEPTPRLRNPDLPRYEEDHYQEPPGWDLGLPEEDVALPDFTYSRSPVTWGRALFEGFTTEIADTRIENVEDTIEDVGDQRVNG